MEKRKKQKRKIKNRLILSGDTEDNSKGKIFFAVFYDGDKYFVFKNKKDIKLYFDTLSVCEIWFTNLEYDISNLFENPIKEVKLFMGKRIYKAQYKNIIFKDTLNHFPASVEKLGKIVGLKKLKANFRSLKYCKRDTEIVFEFVKKLKEIYSQIGIKEEKLTIGSTMLNFWYKKFFPEFNYFPMKTEVLKSWKQAYYGGRVEASYIGKIKGYIQYIDVNSMYPSVMIDNNFPYPYNYIEKINLGYEGVSYVKVKSDLIFPVLPFRRKDGKVIFPNGVFSGWFNNCELNFAVSKGVKIIKKYKGFYFPYVVSPFEKYIKFFYNKRKKTVDEFYKKFYKLCMNCLYGKFGQYNDGKKLISEEKFESKLLNGKLPFNIKHKKVSNVVFYEAKKYYPLHSNIIWASYVTSFARMKLYNLIEKLSKTHKILYYDTDGVFILGDKKIKSSKKLGEFKLENVFSEMEIKGCKFYKTIINNIVAYTVKGVPYINMKGFFEMGNVSYKKPMKIKEGLRRGIKSNVWVKMKKTKNSEYDKGKVLKNGDVIPFKIKKP